MLVTEVAIGEQGVKAIAAVVQDPAKLLSARSPGSRGDGAMFDTKGRLVSAKPSPPDRVLQNNPATDPATEGAAPPAAFYSVPLLDDSMPEPAAYSAVGEPDPFGDGPYIQAPFGGPIVPVGGPIFGGGTPFVPVTPIPTAVPEPAGWLMLIVGLFVAGAVLRKTKTPSGSPLALSKTR